MSKHVVTFISVCNDIKARRTIDMNCANVSKHVGKFTFVRKYVKTRRTIDIIFTNVYKHVVQLTLFLQMCQNTS